MSVTLVLQAAGWVAVLVLVAAELLVQRGRLSRDQAAFRVVGSVAAGAVVALSVWTEIWPVAVLGLLWLRTEVWRHRLVAPPQPSNRPKDGDLPNLVALDTVLAQGGGETAAEQPVGARPHPHAPHLPHPHLPHPHLPHLPHPHLPHPHLGPRLVDRLFKIEMGVLIAIAVVMFGLWMGQNSDSFHSRTSSNLCRMMGQGCR